MAVMFASQVETFQKSRYVGGISMRKIQSEGDFTFYRLAEKLTANVLHHHPATFLTPAGGPGHSHDDASFGRGFFEPAHDSGQGRLPRAIRAGQNRHRPARQEQGIDVENRRAGTVREGEVLDGQPCGDFCAAG